MLGSAGGRLRSAAGITGVHPNGRSTSAVRPVSSATSRITASNGSSACSTRPRGGSVAFPFRGHVTGKQYLPFLDAHGVRPPVETHSPVPPADRTSTSRPHPAPLVRGEAGSTSLDSSVPCAGVPRREWHRGLRADGWWHHRLLMISQAAAPITTMRRWRSPFQQLRGRRPRSSCPRDRRAGRRRRSGEGRSSTHLSPITDHPTGDRNAMVAAHRPQQCLCAPTPLRSGGRRPPRHSLHP